MLETPILDTLNDYLSKNPVRMHVPFHAGVSNNDVFPKEIYNLDISEVSGYDIEGKDNPIFQSEKITADFFGVSHSFYLTGGASQGLLGSLIALRKYGKKVILARNVHKSVINGVILAGLEPIWLDVDFLDEWGIFSRINPEELEKIILKNSDVSSCVIVSPTYEGVISDVQAISELCHKRDIPLIVDEAHGAHLYFLSNQQSALGLGADLVVQSWHKSLGSLTQSGVLHLVNNEFFTYYDLKRSLDLVSSTSPSFLLLLSLELTRKHLAETRGEKFQLLLKEISILRSEIKKIDKVGLLESGDPLKIYIKMEKISGIDFAFELYKKHSIEIESANEIGLLMMIGSNFNSEIENKIISAIKKISRDMPLQRHVPIQAMFDVKPLHSLINPRQAFLAGFQHKKDLEYECEINAPCPPGYVSRVPGNKK